MFSTTDCLCWLLVFKREIEIEIEGEQEPFHRECFYVTGTWFTDQQSSFLFIHLTNRIAGLGRIVKPIDQHNISFEPRDRNGHKESRKEFHQ